MIAFCFYFPTSYSFKGVVMKTTLVNEKDITRKWYIVNASGKTLGRMAVKIANLLRGRNKAFFAPHQDLGDFVIVINAKEVKLTGKKEEQKIYRSFSGYGDGLREHPASFIRERVPERLIKDAVRRMLPKNRLMRQVFCRLKVYAGSEHPHSAQKPETIEI
jgi:large subunit ribosomal protein L13